MRISAVNLMYPGQRGFSLLEMLVAISLLGLLLGFMYQVASGATRNVRVAERYSYATVLAESLLADHGNRGREGYRAAGNSGDFDWVVQTRAFDGGLRRQEVPLQWVSVTVSWGSLRRREVALATIRPLPPEARP